MQKGLVALVIADAGFIAAMGANLWPVLLPENTTVGATYQIVGGKDSPTFEGAGMQRVRLRFGCSAPTYAQADGGRKALRDLLDGFRGILTDGTFIHSSLWSQDIDFYDYEPRQFRCVSEYYIMFTLP